MCVGIVMIDVKIFATLREGRQKSYQLDPSEFKTALDILNYLEIPAADVAILLINGFHSTPEASVKDGDIVSLFPPCAGG